MSDWKYKIYGKIQHLYHRSKGSSIKDSYKVYYAYNKASLENIQGKQFIINGQATADFSKISSETLFFKGDNIIDGIQITYNSSKTTVNSANLKSCKTNYDKWLQCIKNAAVEDGWKNSGFYLTAYIKEQKQWCLSNWIWTSAAIARVLSACGLKKDAQKIADAYLREQLSEGGWIVRYDFIQGHLNRLAAPNDASYIARHSMLVTYRDTNEQKYLDSAKRCADWIMVTSCSDGLVLFGYNVDKNEWITDRNIVDIGFTTGLFAELYEITGEAKYKEFLTRFVKTFINTFYDENAKMFASHVNGERKRNGGYFSRGQAWAMEGLMDVYKATEDMRIFNILENVTLTVADHQLSDGGWYCNLQKARALMGEDCKGISAIARSLLMWTEYSDNKEKLIKAGKKAYDWCAKHTDDETGMILSFSCNGAIAHSPNTSTGILYANAYAIEVENLLRGYGVLNE
jgi:rhamnogalacturonyl hydrolase YesR